jgi:molybdenum-dependent DNA-binding transcriptional regulator ModE
MNINQEQLLMFQTVIETGSFSAAARKLGKVPSAVSMSIANLEIDLNLNLFERIGREPTPTPAAMVLYEKTQKLLIEINQWKQHAHALSAGLESTLNIVVVSELLHTNWTDYITLLEQALIKFLEGNEKKRKDFYLYYEKIEQAELLYFINEFIALEYVQNFGGIYKVNDVPVGFKIPDIIDWFATNEDVYKGLKLKVQEFHSNKVTS